MKYEVTIKQIEQYIIDEVEAASEDEAIKKAWEMMGEKGKEHFHDDSDSESEAYELE